MTYCIGRDGLNPFRTGRGLSTGSTLGTIETIMCLNPFRTGRGLSTDIKNNDDLRLFCLNPFRTGRGLSTLTINCKR